MCVNYTESKYKNIDKLFILKMKVFLLLYARQERMGVEMRVRVKARLDRVHALRYVVFQR